MSDNKYTAYTDGSCDNLNPKRPGGSAYIIFNNDGQEVKRMSKGFMGTTNNRMELLAIISVVNSIPQNSSVIIYTDSEYCMKAVRIQLPKKNADQLAIYHRIVNEKQLQVSFIHVKGHSGNEYNELCDKMARGEYNKMKKSSKAKSKRKQKTKPLNNNELEERYYSCITTKNRRKKVKKK